jgi:phosphohistidine phosphatase SixA
MKTEYDHKLIRCPKLGDEMTFGYCLQEAGDLPCPRIVSCWFRAFDVAKVLEEHLTSEQRQRFALSAPGDKVSSLIEIIERAKKPS